MHDTYKNNPLLNQIYLKTTIVRKPLRGIVSGYHSLPYIIMTPDDENPSHSIEINGKVDVSPRFIISPNMLGDSFSEVFDPSTFDKELSGRFFSFAYGASKNLQVKNAYLHITPHEKKVQEKLDELTDRLGQEENVTTALIWGPAFQFYPVSIDRFISEIIEREFML